MKHKILEIRDRATLIFVVCVDMNPCNYFQERVLRRLGYPCDRLPNVILFRADGSGNSSNDPYSWNDRTFSVAHNHIIKKWYEINEGDVIDVEFILGETTKKKVSEIHPEVLHG